MARGLGHTNSFVHMGEPHGLFPCVKALLCREQHPGELRAPWKGLESLELI